MLTDFDIAEYISKSVVVVPIIVGIVQAVKMTGLPSKYSAIVSVIVGLLIAFFTGPSELIGHNFMAGIVYGLSASGLFSGVKSIVTNDGPDRDEKGRFISNKE